jgi:spermidine synthase
MREAAGAFDAILLDVDNGPDALTRAANDALYREDGLRSARRALDCRRRPRRLVRRAGRRLLEAARAVRVRRRHAHGPRRPCEERRPPHDLDRGPDRRLTPANLPAQRGRSRHRPLATFDRLPIC